MNKLFTIAKHIALSLALMVLIPLHGAGKKTSIKRSRADEEQDTTQTSQPTSATANPAPPPSAPITNEELGVLARARATREKKHAASAPEDADRIPSAFSAPATTPVITPAAASSTEKETICPICSTELTEITPEELITLHKGQEIRAGAWRPLHTFCRACLREALKKQPVHTCLLCPTRLTPEEIRTLQRQTTKEAIIEAKTNRNEALVAQLLEIPGINSVALQTQLAEINTNLAAAANLVILAANNERQATPPPQQKTLEELTWEAATCNNADLIRDILTIPSISRVRILTLVLLASIMNENQRLVEYALAEGADVNIILDQTDHFIKLHYLQRRTPLMLAIATGNLQIVQILLAHTAININASIEFDRSSDLSERPDANLIPPTFYQHTALKAALNSLSYEPRIAEAILNDPRLTPPDPTLVLFHAIKSKNFALAEQAINQGADINAYEDFSPYPWLTNHPSVLMLATNTLWDFTYTRKHPSSSEVLLAPEIGIAMKKIILLLLGKPSITSSLAGERGYRIQLDIIKSEDIELIMRLIELGHSNLRDLAIQICETNNPQLVKAVLDSGISPIETLYKNLGHGKTTLLDSCIAAPMSIKMLLANAAKNHISAAPKSSFASRLLRTQNNGWTLLHLAAYTGDLAEVEHLLATGTDANAKTTYGTSVLCAAILSDHAADLIIPLAAAGANVNEDLVYTAKPPILSTTNIPLINALVTAGADINTCDNYGWTALSHAMSSGADAGYVHALRAAGADTNIIDTDKLTLKDIFNKYVKKKARVFAGEGANPWLVREAEAPTAIDPRLKALEDPIEVTVVADPILAAIQNKYKPLSVLFGSPLDLHTWE